jgi:serine/threonine protein kinase/Tol biopolymer transport system component
MQLEPGSKLGQYEIVSALGAGGMGEVYRARDTTLGREVAVKLLLKEVSSDPERLARFEREARVLASLNHPNIATLHGFEQEDDTSFLVMELVEGETLADRIARGSIPLKEAAPLFLEIAQALDAAHEQGVVHRDLKPANIKIDTGGRVKILDFGLAKAMSPEAEAAPDAGTSLSPTLTLAATQRGEILGTAAYMSPEQARGLAVDRRADVWAFGVCLWEALTGKRLFQGEDASITMARVLDREPDWSELPAGLPSAIHRLLRRCLQKSSAHRLRDIADAGFEIEEAIQQAAQERSRPRAKAAHGRRSPAVPLAIGAVLGGLLVGLALSQLDRADPTPVRRVSVRLGEGNKLQPSQTSQTESGWYPALAPDGSALAYVVSTGDSFHIEVRQLDRLEGEPVDGTEGGTWPFFSPDGRSIAFFADGMLKKVSLEGDLPTELCEAPLALGGHWFDRDTIIFASWYFETNSNLMRVSADGGEPESLIEFEGTLGAPHVLPDGVSVLVNASLSPKDVPSRESNEDRREISVISLAEGADRTPRPLVEGLNPHYLESGHLFFGQPGRRLMVAPFDATRLEVTGPAVRVSENDVSAGFLTGPMASVSRSGSLVYVREGSLPETMFSLVTIDRSGTRVPIDIDGSSLSSPRISPVGDRVAYGGGGDVWIHDLGRSTTTRLTSDAHFDTNPAWTPDGKRVAFRRNLVGIVQKDADGTGEEEVLVAGEAQLRPLFFSPDGAELVYLDLSGFDFRVVSLDDGETRPLLANEFQLVRATLSPDGRWLAYTSDESGSLEVYVRPYPNVDDGRTLVSAAGGHSPTWSPDGSELFYLSGRELKAVEVEAESTFQPGRTTTLFESDIFQRADRHYSVHPDGESFVMVEMATNETEIGTGELVLVENWVEEVKRLAPTG